MPSPNEDTALYADDPLHPLRSLQSLDIVAARRAGGADLVMLVNGPLQADERSQRRLLRKFDTYLGFVASPDFANEFGAPDPATTRIVVKVDARSDPLVFELLKRCEPWVREARATLVVEPSPAAAH